MFAVDEAIREKFQVACFTEVPLDQIHLLVGEIPGRQIKLEPYGIVFRKEFIVAKGGQPAIYVNSYNGNNWLRESADALYDASYVNRQLVEKLWRLLPFINAMHEGCDFSWEREWRVRNGLKFSVRDVVCVILPANGEDDLKTRCAEHGIAVISPGWTYEQIVSELARQQRTTRSFVATPSGAAVLSSKTERSQGTGEGV